MQIDINQTVTTAINKAKANPQFSQDLMRYVQYIALSSCRQDKMAELKQILEQGNMKTLLEFGSESIPEFNQRIVAYINEY